MALAAHAAAQAPPGAAWIWSAAPEAGQPASERAWFVAEIALANAPKSAELLLAADNHVQAFLDGRKVADVDDWREIVATDVTAALPAGRHLLALAAVNDGGVAALLGGLLVDGAPVWVSDTATRAFDAEPEAWPQPEGGTPAVVVGSYGAAPWGRVGRAAGRALFPAAGLRCSEVATGFGSLIALTLDPRGEPVVSVEDGGLLTLHDADGDGRFESATPFCDALRICQGLCFTGEDAWATGRGPQGAGFYHLPPGEAPRHAELIAPITGSLGEHGPHAVMPGPDGRLWIMLGNHVQLGAPLAADSPCRIGYEGHVLPRLVDPNGHAVDIAQPGGTVVAWERATGRFTREAQGFRNAYDMAFAPSGDLFTFDSDMEWDIGLPWYRATRVVHVLPGGDYGWRTGSADWPAWYPDSLPPVMDLGRGSPTGVAWCDSLAFPPAWRDTLLLGDWSQGRIVAVHLQPEGISYRGRSEVLLSGRPLPVTDFVFERDGALLISVGGRGARGALLRLRGTAEALAQAAADAGFRQAPRPPSVDDATPIDTLSQLLASPDRWVRWVAARALERHSMAEVEALARGDAPASVRAEALLVLARQMIATGTPERERSTIRPLARALLPLLQVGTELSTRLVAARALELELLIGVHESIAGTGQPEALSLGAELLHLLPSGSPALDRELAALLARTEAPGAHAALLAALDEEATADGAISLLYALSSLRNAATADEARAALERLSALRSRPGGNSYQGYLDAIERRLIAQAPSEARDALRALAHPAAPVAAVTVSAGAPPRDPDRTRAYVEATLDAPERSLDEGALVFARACAACHQRGPFTGRGGPDLSTVGSRLQAGDLMTAIMQPSRDVSDQYRSTVVTLRDGRELSGVVVRDDGAELELITGLGTPQLVRTEDVAERRFSQLSAMPDGLIDGLSLTAIADLCAWLLAPDPPRAPKTSAWTDLRSAPLAGWTLNGSVLRGSAPEPDVGEPILLPFASGAALFEAELRVPAGRCGIQLNGDIRAGAGRGTWGALLDPQDDVLVAADWLMVGPSLDLDGWNHLLIDTDEHRVRVVLNGIEAASLERTTSPGQTYALVVDPGTPLVEVRTLASRPRTP